MFYIQEVLQTQAFDTLIQTIMWISLWVFVIIRLNRIEGKLDESSWFYKMGWIYAKRRA